MWKTLLYYLIYIFTHYIQSVRKYFIVFPNSNYDIISSLARITSICLPFQSKFLYVGSDRGNVHIVNIETFLLSGYIINWNKAIDL